MEWIRREINEHPVETTAAITAIIVTIAVLVTMK